MPSRASQESGYKSFLEQFTSYTLAQVNEREVEAPEYIIRITDQIQELQKSVGNLSAAVRISPAIPSMQKRLFEPLIPFSTSEAVGLYIEDYLTEKGLTQYSYDLFDSYRITLAQQIMSNKPKLVKNLSASQVRELVDDYINNRTPYSN